MKIAVVQPRYPKEGTATAAEECLEWMQAQLDRLQPGDCDLILLPEYANVPGIGEPRLLREFAMGPGRHFLREAAATAIRLRCCIALGTVGQSDSRWLNRSVLLGPDGEPLLVYDKIHLTEFESGVLGLSCGNEIATGAHRGVRFGFAVCFDQYFPEYIASLASRKADVILVPSYQRSETAERIVLLSRARAVDSGAYLVRSSYAMETAETGGHSLVASPEGAVVCDAGSTPGLTICDIDLNRKFAKPASHGQPLVEHRTLIERHRRPALYRLERKALEYPGFPILCAHRGLSSACPENTLPAFAAAIAVGAHEIEFDIRASKDGVPVVSHDKTVDRATDGQGRIGDLEWQAIRQLDAGVKQGPQWRGVRIPTFWEVLELAANRVVMNIHMKEVGPGGVLLRQVCDLLRKEGLAGTAYLALDSAADLEAAACYAPEIKRACLAEQQSPSRQIAIAKEFGCSRIQFGRNVADEEIAAAREAGMICNLFWSDESADALEYIAKGIDVVLTNCAAALIADGLPERAANTSVQRQ